MSQNSSKNQSTSHKRKSYHSFDQHSHHNNHANNDGRPLPSPAKRPRHDNRDSPSTGAHWHGELPPLPPISPEYTTAVFTHNSIIVQKPEHKTQVNYDRLEFLGDAQIEHIASLVIWDTYTTAFPGKMSTIREALVRNETLCEFARLYGFDRKLKTATMTVGGGGGSAASKDRTKIYADVFEAYVAAVILSDPTSYHAGFDVARSWLEKLWEPRLSSFKKITEPDVKAKETLAKLVLLKNVKLNYVDEREMTIDRERGKYTCYVGVYLTGLGYHNQHLGSGVGDSKNNAGHQAASAALRNHPLIDEVIKKKAEALELQRRTEAVDKEKNENGHVSQKEV